MSDLAEMTLDENQKTNQNFATSVGDIEYQKESLVILASLGTTKEYLGVEMSLEKIHKLSDKEVEKYFNRYQIVAGQKMANGLVDSAIMTATKVISCFLPIDDTEELCYDLQNDELVKRELSNIAGLLVVRGGRLVLWGVHYFKLRDILSLIETAKLIMAKPVKLLATPPAAPPASLSLSKI